MNKSYYLVFSMLILFSQLFGQNKKMEEIKLLEVDKLFAKSSLQLGTKKAFEMFLLDDAISLGDKSNPIFGLTEIVDSFGNYDENYILEWFPQKAEVSDCYTMGWTWGEFYTKEKKSGKILKKGKYLNVWKKNSKNHWKVKVDMGNSSP